MDTESSGKTAETNAVQSFDEFLKSKKIDAATFKVGERSQYDELKVLFDQVHPSSFVQQKLFLINKIRRQHQLTEQEAKPEVSSVKKIKPKMSIKPKLK